MQINRKTKNFLETEEGEPVEARCFDGFVFDEEGNITGIRWLAGTFKEMWEAAKQRCRKGIGE